MSLLKANQDALHSKFILLVENSSNVKKVKHSEQGSLFMLGLGEMITNDGPHYLCIYNCYFLFLFLFNINRLLCGPFNSTVEKSNIDLFFLFFIGKLHKHTIDFEPTTYDLALHRHICSLKHP